MTGLHNSCPPHRQNESGSVIVYIFIAIAMFVALSFAVANMVRGSDGGMKEELVKVATGEIVQYTDTLRRAVQTMRVDGLNITGISFDSPLLSGYVNPACVDPSCEIFNSAGGGVKFSPPLQDWLVWRMEGEPLFGEWYISSDVCVADVGNGDNGCENDGEDNEELIVFLPYLKKQICTELNNRMNVENPDGNPPLESGCPWSSTPAKYTGSFSDGESIESTPSAETLRGHPAGCFEVGVCGALEAGTYHFYQVLMAR